MDNSTKKGIMLGVLLLGCAATSILGSIFSNGGPRNSGVIKDSFEKQQKNYAYEKSSEKKSFLIKVYVSGAVVRPGLYDLQPGTRADDAVNAAGGLLQEADPTKVNLAQRLKDGMQVNVPYAKVRAYKVQSNEIGISTKANSKNFRGEPATAVSLVNLNTATAKELISLPGIGPSMAQKIIDYRRVNRFVRIEDLTKVPGIGPAKLERLRQKITV